ncbi:MAG TPA: lysophospholipid acyltransferase family protein [Dongiaceae bacterium]
MPVKETEPAADLNTGQGHGGGDAIVRRPRRPTAQKAWQFSDLVTCTSLALLLPPAWLLPERLWVPLTHALIGRRGEKAIKRIAKSIRAALGDRDEQQSQAIMRQLKAAIYELRLQDLRSWRPGGWRPRMILDGEEYLRHALAGGKGAVLWIAPFVFNSGPTKIVLGEKGYRVSHLSSIKHGFSETKFGVSCLNRVRCTPEDRHLAERIVFDRNAPGTAMRRMMRALKAGEVVSILAVSTEGSDMVKTPVFGGTVPVAVGAPRLAALTGAPLLPVFAVRDPKLGFRVVVESPIVLASDQTSDERCVAATAEFLRRSEPWVRQYPEQWRAWSKWRGLGPRRRSNSA